jgi:hypothetical protein
MLKLDGRRDGLCYTVKADYSWNSIDRGTLLPSAKFSYELSLPLTPFVAVSRSRQLPDLHLLSFNDSIPGLGIAPVLNSYRFLSDPGLSSPVTSVVSAGIESRTKNVEFVLGLSLKRIEYQITLSYSTDSSGNLTVHPVNINDAFLDLLVRGKAAYGPFSGELWGSIRRWNQRHFPDDLEKGPAAMGFGRISFLRQFFVPRLYLGGSFEIRAASRRDYRSITTGFTPGFFVASGRLEFRYKDLTFWLNDENLTNAAYITWWDYYESSRTVWWGLRWNFFD